MAEKTDNDIKLDLLFARFVDVAGTKEKAVSFFREHVKQLVNEQKGVL